MRLDHWSPASSRAEHQSLVSMALELLVTMETEALFTTSPSLSLLLPQFSPSFLSLQTLASPLSFSFLDFYSSFSNSLALLFSLIILLCVALLAAFNSFCGLKVVNT